MNPLDSILFPSIEPNQSGYLPVSDLHTIYWETCGNPAGIPVIFLHGGPGSGITPTSRRFFDPALYHIVLIDQRGAGKSTPPGEIRDNTTQHLIADIEAVREMLSIDQWLVFGGSWGSTLSLAYSQAHPARCLGLILRGIWMASPAEVDWWMNGTRNVFPEAWETYAGFLPEDERHDILGAYERRLLSDDPAVYLPAARVWEAFENQCAQLLPPVANPAVSGDRNAANVARLECLYFRHNAFMQPGELLAGVARIRHLPCVIVHGRYDMICPVRYAHVLHAAWPGSVLQIVPDAGHSALEPGIAARLVAATGQFAQTGHF
ncbi:prolyl aminopeptidase [Leeia oryzae]|uniref:prolyl aminopeptidase n=1 Tax=Leeia oryzae TaxID=356662 RepID=UPI00036A053F|nr:prolyl aminopeptidase [Leeia oryzae]